MATDIYSSFRFVRSEKGTEKLSVRKFACFDKGKYGNFTDFGPLKRKILFTGL